MPQHISSWNHLVHDIPCTPREFLDRVVVLIESRNVPQVRIQWVTHGRGSLGRRRYLRVSHRETYMDIGAFPYGDGFALSWVHQSRRSNDLAARVLGFFISLYSLIPWMRETNKKVLRPMQGWISKDRRTIYHKDDEIMFQKIIHECIVAVLMDLTSERGNRTQIPRINDLFSK